MSKLINFFYFLLKVLSKITGQSFSFSNDGEDFVLFKYLAKIKKGKFFYFDKKISNENPFLRRPDYYCIDASFETA